MISRMNNFKGIHNEDYLFDEIIVDKYGNEVGVVVTYHDMLWQIYIFSELNLVEKVMFILENENTILISDIRINELKNRGIGTKIISIIESIANDNSVNRIVGNLYSTDDENKERQLHFYAKNGFKISDEKLEKILS